MKRKKSKEQLMKEKLDAKWSKVVRARDKQCLMCDNKTNLHAHHVVKTKARGASVRWLLKNGITLCYDCHLNKYHGTQADAMWHEKYLSKVYEKLPRFLWDKIVRLANKPFKFNKAIYERYDEWLDKRLERIGGSNEENQD